jgi:hypothetical protein
MEDTIEHVYKAIKGAQAIKERIVNPYYCLVDWKASNKV